MPGRPRLQTPHPVSTSPGGSLGPHPEVLATVIHELGRGGFLFLSALHGSTMVAQPLNSNSSQPAHREVNEVQGASFIQPIGRVCYGQQRGLWRKNGAKIARLLRRLPRATRGPLRKKVELPKRAHQAVTATEPARARREADNMGPTCKRQQRKRKQKGKQASAWGEGCG
jgi:hypothetical protein